MMTRPIRRYLPLLLVSLVGASAPVRPAAAPHGVYVEARTASVFCGACHYNGERVTDGRAAVLAWRIDAGSFDGINLAGVKVMAAVRCDDNLAELAAARKSEIVVDADAARTQAAAAWVTARCRDQLGTVVGVRSGTIAFRNDGESFDVASPHFAALNVAAMPDRACCSQPHLVWYTPLMPVENRRVGYTATAEYDVGRVGDVWQRSDENSAFYGSFTH